MRHHHDRLLPRLLHEWEHLRHRPDAIAAARTWGVTEASFDDLDELLWWCGFDRPGDAASEAALRTLVLRAADDPLAARIALQRIVPGLLSLVRRRRWEGPGALEELVGAAWITIREFDPDRRPGCLAAALLAGADYRAFGRARRRCGIDREILWAHTEDERSDARTVEHVSPSDELAAVIHVTRLDGATDDDLRIVEQLLEVGSPTVLAQHLGVTPRTIRNRRDRITERMRRAALAA